MATPTKKKKAPAGAGKRFSALKGSLAKKGAADPSALAAYIGRRKFGNKKFQAMAAAGRAKHSESSKHEAAHERSEGSKKRTAEKKTGGRS
jgi:hypothetical protein